MSQLWGLSEASRISGVPAPTISRYIALHRVQLRGADVVGEGYGTQRAFSLPRLIEMATLETLIKAGVVAGKAARAARVFVDTGQPGQAAGELFADGKTFLVVQESGAKIVNAPAFASVGELMDGSAAAVVVDLNQIVDRIRLASGNGTSTRRADGRPNYETKGN